MTFYRDCGDPTALTQALLDKGFTNADVASMAEVMEDICTECCEAYTPCHCWNDE